MQLRALGRLWRSRRRQKSKLIRHYFLLSLAIICTGLVLSGALEVYFSHRDNLEHFTMLQKEIAASTAFKIDQFLQEHERILKAATKTRDLVSNGLTDEYKWELRRLLVNAPAFTAVAAFDLSGQRRADASRLRPISSSDKPVVLEKNILPNAAAGKTTYGPVYFADGTGPYMVMIVPIERIAGEIIGALQAEVDLKHVGEVMAGVRVGKDGYAYLVSKKGDLIAHPDLSWVLQKRNLLNTAQLKLVLGSGPPDKKATGFIANNFAGKKVFTSFVDVAALDSVVFVEQPIGEIYEPIYASLFRTSTAFVGALAIAMLAVLSIHYRVIRPVEMLRQAVGRISQGDLSARLVIKTGDEFEALAVEFNSMATNLRAAYAEMEAKVSERTTELVSANAKLFEASEHKSRFLANANHELRTPLSSIIGYARILRRDAQGAMTSLQIENLDDLTHNAERLLVLIDGLLDIARIEAGKVELRLEPVNVQEVLHRVSLTVQPMINGQAVRLVQDITPNLPDLVTDRDKLQQVLLNLASNAVKFTEHGEIRFVASRNANKLQLVISDTGTGIPPEDFDKIFDEFHRSQITSNGNHRGTGLGLAIVKKMVGVLGGEIAVASELKKGSSFTVTLPYDSTVNYRV